jgi:two-component system, LuxR family, response regulator DctR
MTTVAPRVFVVDDEPSVREALLYLIASRGLVAEGFSSAETLLAAFKPEWRGCILSDVRMPGLSGLEMFDRLQGLGCRLPVLLLTGHGDVPMAVRALQNGVRDFIEKPFNANDLVDKLIVAIEADRIAYSRHVVRTDVQSRLDQLSVRERDVLQLLCSGLQNKVIAEDLGIAIRTVEVHRARVFEKMGVHNAIELATLISEHQQSGGTVTHPVVKP